MLGGSQQTLDPRTIHRGRPRRAATDAAIIRAAVDLMGESGVAGTSLAAVARRAGVARATVYLRWPSRSALVGAAARSAVGGQLMPLTGKIEDDIRVAATWLERVFAIPAFPALVPEVVRGVLARPPDLSFDSVAPRRREFGRLYRENAKAQGFDPSVDAYLVFDLLLGTGLGYLLANGQPMSHDDWVRLAEVTIRGLRTARTYPLSNSVVK
jgi:AcrR family transcriptional regulator